jgi:hypothetical protein
MGDGQHGWAAAEWVMMMRNLFVREEKDNIVIGAGIFPQWLESGGRIAFGPTLTRFGALSVNIDTDSHMPHVKMTASWRAAPAEVEIQVPGFEKQAVTDFERIYPLKAIES